jgi:GH15 family glucan-1,4-alpha-glucosidase
LQYGLIGNCQSSAIVDQTGNVVWMCWPRFDSSSVFAGLLDSQRGGSFSVESENGNSATQQSYIENTNVLKTIVRDGEGVYEIIDFFPRFFRNHKAYRPNMLVRLLRPLSGTSRVRIRCRPTYDYGRIKLRSTCSSETLFYEGAPNVVQLQTDIPLSMIEEERCFQLKAPQFMVLTWGKPEEEMSLSLCLEYLDRTSRYWQTWVKHCGLPSVYQEQVIRSALTLKLHQFEDTGAFIAATTTSIPEAPGTPRNWDYRFCWLRDSFYTVSALRKLTHFEEMEAFERYLSNLVANDAELQPVYSITGESKLTEEIIEELDGYEGNRPVRVGNAAYLQRQYDSYGQMILALYPLYADCRFRSERSERDYTLLSRLLSGIEKYIDAPDAGIWEFRGKKQVHTYTLLMHWCGAVAAGSIFSRVGKTAEVRKATELELKARTILNQKCWNEKLSMYTQAIESPAADASTIKLINLGFLKADDPRAARHIDAVRKHLELEEEPGLMHRYRAFDDFGDTTSCFLICSFWLAEALGRLGRRQEAIEVFEKTLSTANHLGLMSEDFHPESRRQYGNFPQTYSHVGLIQTAFVLNDPSNLLSRY